MLFWKLIKNETNDDDVELLLCTHKIWIFFIWKSLSLFYKHYSFYVNLLTIIFSYFLIDKAQNLYAYNASQKLLSYLWFLFKFYDDNSRAKSILF